MWEPSRCQLSLAVQEYFSPTKPLLKSQELRDDLRMEGSHLMQGPNKPACDARGCPQPKRFGGPEFSAINRTLPSQHQRASPPLLMSSEGHTSSGPVALGSLDPPLGFLGLAPTVPARRAPRLEPRLGQAPTVPHTTDTALPVRVRGGSGDGLSIFSLIKSKPFLQYCNGGHASLYICQTPGTYNTDGGP